MDFKLLIQRAIQIRKKYSLLEKKTLGRSWTRAEIMQGFVVDIGELMELMMAKDRLRSSNNDIDGKLTHEFSDCLWSVMILAEEYGIDLETSFLQSMDLLESKIDHNLASK